MSDLNRLTKAELIKELEDLKAQEEERNKQIELDMSFTQTDEEKTTKQAKQDRKDFIRKMTGGRWTSEEKYEEYISKQKSQMRI